MLFSLAGKCTIIKKRNHNNQIIIFIVIFFCSVSTNLKSSSTEKVYNILRKTSGAFLFIEHVNFRKIWTCWCHSCRSFVRFLWRCSNSNSFWNRAVCWFLSSNWIFSYHEILVTESASVSLQVVHQRCVECR